MVDKLNLSSDYFINKVLIYNSPKKVFFSSILRYKIKKEILKRINL